jgi:hypothetical protein
MARGYFWLCNILSILLYSNSNISSSPILLLANILVNFTIFFMVH